MTSQQLQSDRRRRSHEKPPTARNGIQKVVKVMWQGRIAAVHAPLIRIRQATPPCTLILCISIGSSAFVYSSLVWPGQHTRQTDRQTTKRATCSNGRDLCTAKKLFYRSANAIFGEIGSIASEEVVLQLIISKCIPVILYGLETCPLTKSDLLSMDFVIDRFFYEII